MRKFLVFATLLSLGYSVAIADTDDASDWIAQTMTALGGERRIGSLESLAVKAECTSPGGGDPALFDPDAVELLRLHRLVLSAHLENDLEGWMATEADDYVGANRGEITHPTKAERMERLGPYLEATQFDKYRDLVPPIVRVSDDGTLGWVIAQVEVEGSQTVGNEQQAFKAVWAWIELYEKRDGRWLRVGNVSNRRPD